MDASVDILKLFPELAAIDKDLLQRYCNTWLQRLVAGEYGIVQLIIDDQRNMQVLIDASGAKGRDSRPDEAFFPIDELLGYIVDQHFSDQEQSHRLHAAIKVTRSNWDETGRDYAAVVGRVGTLYLVCKNGDCQAVMMSDKKAAEGQRINLPPIQVQCLTCGKTFMYEGGELKLKFDS